MHVSSKYKELDNGGGQWRCWLHVNVNVRAKKNRNRLGLSPTTTNKYNPSNHILVMDFG